MIKLIASFVVLMAFAGTGLTQCTSKVNGYVNSLGYKVKIYKPCAMWVISGAVRFPEDGIQGLIVVAEEDGVVIVGTVVRPKAKLDTSAAALLKLMQLNNSMDYIKLGIDNDGDLFVRVEMRERLLDAIELKAAMLNVISASAKVYEATK
jgi:hypothetical protein